MPDLKPEQLLLLVGFVLPGAISMYVYGLKVPQRDFRLQEKVVEAICFSLLNFIVIWLPVSLVTTSAAGVSAELRLWLVGLVGFVALPVAWPFLLVGLLRFAGERRWISSRAKTAWDEFLSKPRTGFWMQVELTDGRLVGGKLGERSFASLFPDAGHVFLEEMWRVDEDGYFVAPWPGNPGLLLKPADYRLVRVYEAMQP